MNGKSHLTTGLVPHFLLVVITSDLLKEDSPLKALTQKMDVGATPLEVTNETVPPLIFGEHPSEPD